MYTLMTNGAIVFWTKEKIFLNNYGTGSAASRGSSTNINMTIFVSATKIHGSENNYRDIYFDCFFNRSSDSLISCLRIFASTSLSFFI